VHKIFNEHNTHKQDECTCAAHPPFPHDILCQHFNKIIHWNSGQSRVV